MAGPPSIKPAAPKLKLKFGSFSTSAANSPTTITTPSAESVALKHKAPKDNAFITPKSATDTPLKITMSKKRPLEDADDTSVKKAKPNFKIKLGSSSGSITSKPEAVSASSRPQMIKLRTKSQILKIKSKAPLGVPPRRDPGHGYDSEAEDIEVDPAIEHQFVIRMMPGEDCEYLRKSIADRLVGTKEHSKNLSLHFFDREGRRAAVSIRGNLYAASLVDLPCIVETHKSWDKKNFFKVADVHQMLLVHKSVKSLDEAKNAELPDHIDKVTWQYPHGLTPPLHNVRQRRFRKRVSNRTIEAVEEEVDRLLRLDAEAMESTAEIVQPNAREEEDEDAEGEDDDGMIQDSIENEQDAEGSDDDNDEFQRIFAEVLAAQSEGGDASEAPALSSAAVLPATELQASPDALHGTTETPETAQQPQTVPPTPAGGPSATEEESAEEDESDDDADDDDDDGSELDEGEKARQEEETQLREDVKDIKKELQLSQEKYEQLTNKMLRQKLGEKIAKLKRDLKLKMANLGLADEEDEDEDY